MRRVLVTLFSIGLALAGFAGNIAAQEKGIAGIVTNADGSDVTSRAGLNPTANGEGGTIIYGDITTGPGYHVIGPLNVVESAPLAAPEPEPMAAPAPESVAETQVESGTTTGAVATEIDRDADNYLDADEYAFGLDPTNADTDRDGVADGDEPRIYGSDPTVFDSDGDGIGDGEEIFGIRTDPLVWEDHGAPAAGAGGSGTVDATQSTADASQELAQATSEEITAVDGDASALGTGNAAAAPGTVTRGGNGMALLGPDGAYNVSETAPPTVNVAGDTDVIEVVTPEDNAPAEPAPSEPASNVAACESHGSWLDMQAAYEAAGMTAADPALVDALDPDYDGIACEEYM